VLGLTISYHADTAASATVAGIAVAQFFVVLIVIEAVDAAQRLRRRRQVAR
jgi:manganese/iron transport system permease protein